MQREVCQCSGLPGAVKILGLVASPNVLENPLFYKGLSRWEVKVELQKNAKVTIILSQVPFVPLRMTERKTNST